MQKKMKNLSKIEALREEIRRQNTRSSILLAGQLFLSIALGKFGWDRWVAGDYWWSAFHALMLGTAGFLIGKLRSMNRTARAYFRMEEELDGLIRDIERNLQEAMKGRTL